MAVWHDKYPMSRCAVRVFSFSQACNSSADPRISAFFKNSDKKKSTFGLFRAFAALRPRQDRAKTAPRHAFAIASADSFDINRTVPPRFARGKNNKKISSGSILIGEKIV